MKAFVRIATLGTASLLAGLLAGCGNPSTTADNGNASAAQTDGIAAATPGSGEATDSAATATAAATAAGTGSNQRTEKDGDALVPGTRFNATSTVKCVVPGGSAARECKAGVVRDKDGTATVEVAWPDGRSRAIFFDAAHKVFGADTNEADGSARYPVKSSQVEDRTIVTIGPERYEIVNALVTGG